LLITNLLHYRDGPSMTKMSGERDPDTEAESDGSLESRRRSIRRLLGATGAVAGAGVASGTWLAPVAKSVVLPGHAQTTGAVSLTDPCSITVICTGSAAFDVVVEGFVLPPTPGITVNLSIQLNNGGSIGDVDPFDTVVTDALGEYSASGSYSSTIATDIRVIASMPDFPEAGEAECEIAFTDPGPHRPDSYYDAFTYYFCQYPPAGGF
jgi:hypothetical protein